MSLPLPDTERITWRIDSADLDLLRLLFPGDVNSHARVAIHAYCERIRSASVHIRSPDDRTPDLGAAG